MTENDRARSRPADLPAEAEEFGGEENTASQSSPAKDFGSAAVIGVFAVTAIVMSLRLDVPGDIYTAPGLLPFVTSLTLLLMAVVLGVRAVRAGGASGFIATANRAAGSYVASEEGRRSLLLIAIVVAYISLVGLINFDLRFPTPVFVFRLSSYEVISITVITAIMKLFWRVSLLRCFLVSMVTIEVLVAIFRYGFGIIMPESF